VQRVDLLIIILCKFAGDSGQAVQGFSQVNGLTRVVQFGIVGKRSLRGELIQAQSLIAYRLQAPASVTAEVSMIIPPSTSKYSIT